MMLPFNLDPVVVLIMIGLAVLLSNVRPTPPPAQVFVLQAPPPPQASGGDLILALVIFGMLVFALAGFVR